MKLTDDELMVLCLIQLTGKRAAHMMGLTLGQLKLRRQKLYDKLGVPEDADHKKLLAVVKALKLGIVSVDDLVYERRDNDETF